MRKRVYWAGAGSVFTGEVEAFSIRAALEGGFSQQAFSSFSL
jgi:hypothetical protein